MYRSEVNKDKVYVDWREKSNRLNCFLLWLDWRMKWKDLDHYGPNNAYRDATGDLSPTKKPMTDEQKIWFSFIFGMTYQSEMAWNIYWHFPDLDKINLKEMQEWNLDTFSSQKYARDTKYNKGHVTNQTQSILSIIEPYGSASAYLNSLFGDDESENFQRVYDEVRTKFYKYGRMTSWLTCQSLFETANLPLKPKTQLATDESNWSVRSGLMFLYGKDDTIEAKRKKKLSKDDMKFISEKELEIYDISKDYLNGKYPILSQYLLESHLCQFKKLMLGGSSAHDYPGHSTLDHVSYAEKFEKSFDTNFGAFWNFVEKEHHPILKGQKDMKILGNLCAMTGQLINMHTDYDFLPNMYRELGIEKDSFEGYSSDQIKVIMERYSYSQDDGIGRFLQ